jgi:hypothetical protein
VTPTQGLRLGFRVLGSASSRRRLIDFDAAFAGYASCDDRAEVGCEAYLSAFTYGEEFRRHLEGTGSTRGYDGPCWAPWLWLDLDGEELDAVLSDARRLAEGVLRRYRALDDDHLLLFFSGSKGVHIGLPVTWEPAPSVTFHRTARRFAEALAAAAGAKIDVGVYDKVRLFRAPNSRHPKTGLRKRRLTLDELLHFGAARIRQLAAAPEPFEVPVVTVTNPQAVADWQAALHAVEREAQAKVDRRAVLANRAPQLNRQTLDFIREGADQGDRHRLLYSAAANLAELACPPALAHALLTEAALDSGLPPAEVHRQIECGLKQAGPVGPSMPAPATPAPAAPASSPPSDKRAALQEHLARLWNAPPSGAGEAWESAQERRDTGTHDFPFGANLAGPYDAEGGRR